MHEKPSVALDGVSALADRLEEEPVEAEVEVTPLEIFFDLVFVFAIGPRCSRWPSASPPCLARSSS
jgi:hypothetical protein